MQAVYRLRVKFGVLALAALCLYPGSGSFAAARPGKPHAVRPKTPAAQAPPIADKYATVFGLRIHYLEAGSGPDVILLHGLGGDASNWAATIGPLSQKYHVIVPDQVGFGKSDKPLIDYRVGTLVDFLDSFMSVLKIGKASLVGNSLGGWTAAAFAIAHPEKVDRLVLVDAAGFSLDKNVDPRTLNGLNPSTREGMKNILSLVFYNKDLFSSPAAIDAFMARKMTAGDGYTIQRFIDSVIHGEDMLDNTVSEIKQPTLVVWGRQDMLVPLSTGERYHNAIKGSELLVIDKCAHVPMIEKAGEFNAALLKFLAGQQPEGLSQ